MGSKFDTRSLILCALFSALIAVGAFIRIPIPVVPFTLQTFFVALAGLLLGSKLGAISAIVYLMVGLVGIPVFTKGGGIGYVFQPTFGYLIGFIVGAYVIGKIVEKSKAPSYKRILTASFIGLAVIYIIGMIYYYIIANYYLNSPMSVGSLIFYCVLMIIPGDSVMMFLSAYLAKRILPMINVSHLYNI